MPAPPSLGESSESTEGSTDSESSIESSEEKEEEPPASDASPPPPPVLGAGEGILPAPPSLGESSESTEGSTEPEGVSSDKDLEESTSSGFDDPEGDSLDDSNQDESDMTPFEISENFRNLKLNIVMVKAKLKEISENEETVDLSSVKSQITDLSDKLSESEEKREENKKIILSLMDEIESFKKREDNKLDNSLADENLSELNEKIDTLFTEKESNNDSLSQLKENLKSVESKIEELQKHSSESNNTSSTEENIKDIFDKLDNINSDKSEFKSKIANIESKLENFDLSTTEGSVESSLSSRVEDLEEIINDATTTIHDLSEEFHSFQDETKKLNEKLSPSSDKSEISELEKAIDSIRSKIDDLSVEPPPPPPLPDNFNSEEHQGLSDTVENLEKRMSNFRAELKAEISEIREESNELKSNNENQHIDDEINPQTFAEESPNRLNHDFEVLSELPDANPIVRIGKYDKTYKEWYVIWQLTIPRTDLEKELFNYVSKSQEFESLHWKLKGY